MVSHEINWWQFGSTSAGCVLFNAKAFNADGHMSSAYATSSDCFEEINVICEIDPTRPFLNEDNF